MLVSVDVYTKNLDAALAAFRQAIEAGASDVRLESVHDFETRQCDYFNLCFQSNHDSPAIEHLENGHLSHNTDEL